MPHQSLYRKYRSQDFEEVVGQQHVTRTLQNALTSGRVAHAYLFCGPRGTGKTSTARLLARALNCENGPTPTPCGICALCRDITTGRAMDVVEVDAASETGIDNVREVIINNSRYAPAQGRYKVYIIDEVHDLSRAAFDGLLKTLEEPPPHVVFVLATTEIHKVPATIISRCQRFEFRRGSLEEVRSRVEFVALQEGIEIEPSAANLIARAAQGGWRDALSLLEQVISYADRKVTARDVSLVLGSIEDENLEELARLILEPDALGALRKLDTLLSEGKDLRQLLQSFADYVRDCLLHAMGAAPDRAGNLVAMSTRQGTRLLELVSRAERELRWNTQHRLVLELMILRMTAPSGAETAVYGEDLPPDAVLPGVVPAGVVPAGVVPSGAAVARPRGEPSRFEITAPPPPSPAPRVGTLLSPLDNLVRTSREANSGPESDRKEPAASPSRTAASDARPAPSVPAAAAVEDADWGVQDTQVLAANSVDLPTIQSQWKSLLNRVRTNSRRLATLLDTATPVSVANGVLTLEFKQQYHYHGVEEVSARRAVEAVLGQVVGQPIRIVCTLNAQEDARPKPKTGRKEAQPVTDGDLQQLFPGWDIQEG